MGQFIAVVVGLAFVLLALVFRSLLIPLVASVMNLLSFGAALGVMTAAFQFGWGKSLLGFGQSGPIVSYLPVMMFAILFGLSTELTRSQAVSPGTFARLRKFYSEREVCDI
jgi:RND superfamily putative drug exporter